MSTQITQAFIDTVEGEVARIVAGDQDFTVPLVLLPSGAGEGQWVTIRIEAVAAPPGRSGELQRRLGEDDDGGDIEL